MRVPVLLFHADLRWIGTAFHKHALILYLCIGFAFKKLGGG
jgi:hypothetical protein